MHKINPGTALMTDLYQLTMGQAYFKAGKAEQTAVFNLYFRDLPFGSSYAIAAGLELVIGYLKQFSFTKAELEYLAQLPAPRGDQPLFSADYIQYLSELELKLTLAAVPEGSLIFANEPVLQVQGPLLQAQLVETLLLNLINFSSLIATKATRIVYAAEGRAVVDFGLRRAQGLDGALSAARAAVIGGVQASSNVYAGYEYDIPVTGTHAHSWVMAFDSESEAFDTYVRHMPHNCTLLVDTFNTQLGVERALASFKNSGLPKELFRAVRLDSGDLVKLSKQTRQQLDQAGFPNTKIIASSDLDEYEIAKLVHQKAPIDILGVGTRLITAFDQPAMGGVYKLAGLYTDSGDFVPKMKISDDLSKMSVPGKLQYRRFKYQGQYYADVLYDAHQQIDLASELQVVDNKGKTKKIGGNDFTAEDMLKPIFEQGQCVYQGPHILEIGKLATEQLAALAPQLRRLEGTAAYPVMLQQDLHELQQALSKLN